MLYDSIKEVDPGAEILVTDEFCEWVRSSFSIVGLIRIEGKLEADELRHVISDRIKAAYSLVDDLADEKLALRRSVESATSDPGAVDTGRSPAASCDGPSVGECRERYKGKSKDNCLDRFYASPICRPLGRGCDFLDTAFGRSFA